MDEQYRKLARERHEQAKKRAEEKQQQENALQWKTYQENTLRNCGYAEHTVQALIKEHPFTDCINWTDEWKGDNLPFAFRQETTAQDQHQQPFVLGHNLKDVMLLQDVHRHSPFQTRVGLGISEENWKSLTRQWNMVNPYPVQPVSEWHNYRVRVDATPIAEAVGNQLFRVTPRTEDLRGCGMIRVPPDIFRFIQDQLRDDYWSGQHPFLVMQLVWKGTGGTSMHTEFAVVPIGEEMTPPGTLCLSPAVKTRTQLQDGDTVNARMVTVLPVRPAHKGTGVLLETCPLVRPVDFHPPSEQDMKNLLTQELEKQYILVEGQWIALVDPNDAVWIYRVKRLWSIQNRPVKVASTYGAQVAIEVDFKQGSARSLEDVLEHW